MIEEIAIQTLKEIKKAKKEPYPLYYKEIFNRLAEEQSLELDSRLTMEDYKNINEEFLDKTKETTDFIQNTNSGIETDLKIFATESEKEDISKLVKKFESDLMSKLSRSNEKINELKTELEKAYKELHIDTLTKAYNRKALNDDLGKIIKAGKSKKLNVNLVEIDLDFFKEVNDKYGHLVGDFILIKFVLIVKSLIRGNDKIYRYGGDEFFIIFNRIDMDKSVEIMEKIRKKIEITKFKYKNEILNFTISVGIGCHQEGDSVDDFIDRADKALYESKKTRNRVTKIC
jgi:diguanylate cyclase (GGDEF)-like protein